MANELLEASLDGVPAVIAAYRAFLDDPVRNPRTRQNYRSHVRAFFSWAERRGLTLEAIDYAALLAYRAEIAASKSAHVASVLLTPVRGVFRSLVSSGVLNRDPYRLGTDDRFNGPAPAIPLSELRRMVLETGQGGAWEEGDRDFQAGLVMLAPLSIKTMDPAAVSRFTGIPEPTVREFAERLIDSGIWQPNGKLACEWDDPERGGLAFMLDVWVATGDLERAIVPEDEPASEATAAAAAGETP